MPSLSITYPAGGLAESDLDALADQLTAALLRAERIPDSPIARDLCWIELHETTHHFSGARPTTHPRFRVHLTLPCDVLGPEGMQGLVSDVTDLLLRVAGGPADPRRVWVIVTEVPDGRWGAVGRVVDFGIVRAARG